MIDAIVLLVVSGPFIAEVEVLLHSSPQWSPWSAYRFNRSPQIDPFNTPVNLHRILLYSRASTPIDPVDHLSYHYYHRADVL